MIEPLVDICIPVHNAYGYVERCLNSFHKTCGHVPYRFVIHDDASDEPEASWIRHYADVCYGPLILARSDKQCWFTTSVNRCLQLTKAPWILVVNSDIEMQDPNWFFKFFKWHNEFGRSLIGCPDSQSHDGAYETDGKVQGHLWFFHRDDLRHVGLLDESNQDNIHIRSDDEWSNRWRSKGFKTVIACDVRHVHGGESHPGGGASWNRDLWKMPTRLEHVAEARMSPMRILVEK